MKRILALLLAIVLSIGLLPSFASAQSGENEDVPLSVRFPQTNEIWKAIEQTEGERIEKHGETCAEAAKAAYALVEASDSTEPGSLEWHGNAFFWRTVDGASCLYNPYYREKIRKAQSGTVAVAATDETGETVQGSIANSKNVAVFQPYYGIDSSFTTQYVREGESVAEALGGTCSVYRTSKATIDNIASALSSCAVVIFDSHGCTDYENGDDCVSCANTSYLCLRTGTGITDADMEMLIGTYGRYAHAVIGGTTDVFVDGTAIANHMSKKAPKSLLWMAICLGMATDGFQKPMRANGVQTVYGYSQSVTFSGDYAYEESFFYAVKLGATVMSAISLMKREHGNWDPAYKNYSQTYVNNNKVAYPVVVSDEDAYPGQGKVDAVQTVKGKGRIKSTDFLYGDVNGDGRVGVTDASLLLRYLVNTETLTRDQLLRADVKANSVVDAADASAILRRVVRLIQKFDAEP